jgi:hypothetical protein
MSLNPDSQADLKLTNFAVCVWRRVMIVSGGNLIESFVKYLSHIFNRAWN